MQVENLLIDYLNLREDKRKAVLSQDYFSATLLREKERMKSKEICDIIEPNALFNWKVYEEIIDKYCMKNYNCSIYQDTGLKSIKRIIKLNDLGI